MTKRILVFLIIACLTFLVGVKPAFANDCRERSNNVFGIGLAQPHDEAFSESAALVNSAVGDWGYVTVIVQEDDRNTEKWQSIFDKLRELHLIPIVRIATKPQGDSWRRPEASDVEPWVKFLSSLNWVVENRYIILFNEPNHGAEWGGAVDPAGYARLADSFAKALKARNKDFFIMLAGLDNGSPNLPPNHASVLGFLTGVKNAVPNIFDNIDGWDSHSYANPGFVGSQYGTGLKSVRAYHSELLYLEQLGISKELPVFITEVGWPHAEGVSYKSSFPTADEAAKIFVDYFSGPASVTNDKRVCAITPFILDYQGGPFDHFSWKRLTTGAKGDSCLDKFYPQYCEVQKINKIKGNPIQKNLINIKADLPRELTEDSVHNFKIELGNFGQAIWEAKDGYKVSFIDGQFGVFCEPLKGVKPGSGQTVSCTINTPKGLGDQEIKIGLYKEEELIQELYTWKFQTTPLPKISFRVGLLPNINKVDNDYGLQIFDKDEKLVYEKKNLRVVNGLGVATDIRNIVIGEKYRIVVLKDYYLPRQEFVTFQTDSNPVKFQNMLALDRDRDGQFTIMGDVLGISNK